MLLFHRTRIDPKVEVPHGEPRRDRQALPIEIVLLDGRLALRYPGATTMRSLAQTSSVKEDWEASFLERFFLGRATTSSSSVESALSGVPGLVHRLPWAPGQADQKLPDMALVIVYPELLLDQVGHPRAGPQWGLVAQPLGTREQKFGELCPLFVAHTRLAARPSGFPKSRRALGPKLVHQAGYGLADQAELASNLRLVLTSLPQAQGLKATFLQGIKIASYSGGVSRARLDATNSQKYCYIMRDSVEVQAGKESEDSCPTVTSKAQAFNLTRRPKYFLLPAHSTLHRDLLAFLRN
jgi:hypothetical protein